ncbi:putative ATP-dependent RNA helicase [Cotonvirus japonicus]|uniref:ATP-dependent RNA helicase n=1 Tax=Cotonvirus japonicus TaxID=2811091 RepID=A0ABM7NTK9_9VIRU|nr:putative ATP-dependent RNA helicase [Cotonvirus japonicus]BCS83512.1 putative ATP-dependent RNA helicase [Cotonvirus japonicus]
MEKQISSSITIKKINYKTHDDPNKFINHRQNIVNIVSMVNKLTNNKLRTEFIIQTIIELYNSGKNVLIVSDSLCQIHQIFEFLLEIECSITKFAIHKISRLLPNKSNHIILAEYGYTLKGSISYDIDAVLLCTPRNFIEKPLSSIIKKNPLLSLIIDIVDLDNFIFIKYGMRRNNYYKDNKFIVHEFNISDYDCYRFKTWDNNFLHSIVVDEPKIQNKL